MTERTDTREKGRKGELLACDFLCQNGAKILDRNFYFKGGEIDIIAFDRSADTEYLCFIEVKARKDISEGYPEEAVTFSKQRKIIKGAQMYLNLKSISYDTPMRFDVVSILGDDIRWIKNAFTT